MSKSSFYEKPKPNTNKQIFSNTYIVMFIVIVSFACIGYAMYYYIKQTDGPTILSNSSYYGSDISLYEPTFREKTKSITDCINICENDITCDGITYNSDTKACLGTKNGTIRNESDTYSAWVKPPKSKINTASKDFSKIVLLGYTTSMTTIDSSKFQNPFMIGYFTYSFNITIYDFYKNYGSWRHIMHKGTPIPPGTILNYQSWENLIVDYPVQNIGIWLAPFTNNLRIAVTTTSLANTSYGSNDNAFVEKCNSTGDCYITDTPGNKWIDTSRSGDGSIPKQKIETYVEYFDNDMQNIPINTQLNITLIFRGRDAEIYYNGKIVKIVRLDGITKTTNSALYVMSNNTFGGEINNLVYYPDTLLLGEIQSIMSLNPNTEPS